MSTVLRLNNERENLAFLMLIKDECINELKSLDIPFDEYARVGLRKHRTSSFGVCKKRRSVVFDNVEHIIEINDSLVSLCLENKLDIDVVKNTLLHEYIHTVDGCFNHGADWKRYANMLNMKFGYDIKRCSSYEERGVDNKVIAEIDKISNVRYIIKCQKCGQEIKRTRKSKLITHLDNYRCGCGGKLERIK